MQNGEAGEALGELVEELKQLDEKLVRVLAHAFVGNVDHVVRAELQLRIVRGRLDVKQMLASIQQQRGRS